MARTVVVSPGSVVMVFRAFRNDLLKKLIEIFH
jgi:hypothetical protein